MILVVGTFRLSPAKLEEAKPVINRMIDASRAEPGCLDYSYAQDLLDPGLIHVQELWRDQRALDAHFSTPHLLQWRAAWQTLGIHDRELAAYDVGEPRST